MATAQEEMERQQAADMEAQQETGQAPEMSDIEYLRQRTSKRHEGQEFGSDEDYYRQMRADADEDDAYMKKYRENEDMVNNLFNSDPRAADFWNQWKQNPDRNPIAYMIRVYGTDGLKEELDDPQFADKFEEANKEYLQRIAEGKDYAEKVQQNLDKSIEVIDAWAAKNGVSTDEADKIAQQVFDRYKRIHLGELNEDDLDWVYKAQNHDVDVENAERDGEIKGRNQRIQEKLRQGSGNNPMPSLGGTASSASAQAVPMVRNEREQYQNGNTPASAAPETRTRRR